MLPSVARLRAHEIALNLGFARADATPQHQAPLLRLIAQARGKAEGHTPSGSISVPRRLDELSSVVEPSP
jgi:hypothetical protein